MRRGWKRLKDLLTSRFSDIQFKLTMAALITNKQIHESVKVIDVEIEEDIVVPFEFFGRSEFEEMFEEELKRCGLSTRQ